MNTTDPTAYPVKMAHMAYGGDYNPEQWPEDIWNEDVRLMQEAGVNLVSLGIFSWAKLEPQPGQYDFAWLDRIVALLHANGIKIDLASATASPPPWLAKLYPESLPVTREGVRLWPGGRQQYCPNSSAYREAAAALVRRIAERYGAHPAVVMWHINNEYACHVAACYCDASAAAFRVWLEQRYGTLDALNAAWGTAFWSQQYGAWDEVQPPRSAPTFANPTQQLDWHRFSSDALLECFEMERAILKEATPDLPVTTNFMHAFKPLDYWKWAAREDVVSLDMYPDPSDPAAHMIAALNYDLMRSLGGGRPWLLMEHATSQVNWRPRNLVKTPGQMRLWSHQAIARGSNGAMFFQWRAAKAGAEKFHSALVPHVGTNSRTWREVVAFGAELGRMDAVLPTRVQADVAIVWEWESWWALELDSKPSGALDLFGQIRAYYEPLYARNVTLDFVHPDADLSGYQLVLVPNLYLVRAESAQNIENYVAEGGTLVMSFFSGIVNEDEHIWLGGYPAPFRTMLGLRVEEFVPYADDQSNTISADGASYGTTLWSDVIDLEGAKALASFDDGYYAGGAAITRNEFGSGVTYYVGTQPEAAGMAWVLERACADAGVKPVIDLPAGIEAVRREGEDGTLLYVLNHQQDAVEIDVGQPTTDLLSGEQHAGAFSLPAQGVAILQVG